MRSLSDVNDLIKWYYFCYDNKLYTNSISKVYGVISRVVTSSISYDLDKKIDRNIYTILSETRKTDCVYTCYFKSCDIYILNSICDQIDDIRSDKSLKMMYSYVLQKSINYWVDNGRRSKLNSLADHIYQNNSSFVDGFNKVFETNPSLIDLVPRSWFADCPNGKRLVFIDHVESNILNRFNILKPKTNVDTPGKVLSKMILNRLERIMNYVTHGNMYGRYDKIIKKIGSHIDMKDVESFNIVKKIMMEDSVVFSEIKHIFKEIEEISSRKEYNDSVFQEAANLFSVRNLHKL